MGQQRVHARRGAAGEGAADARAAEHRLEVAHVPREQRAVGRACGTRHGHVPDVSRARPAPRRRACQRRRAARARRRRAPRWSLGAGSTSGGGEADQAWGREGRGWRSAALVVARSLAQRPAGDGVGRTDDGPRVAQVPRSKLAVPTGADQQGRAPAPARVDKDEVVQRAGCAVRAEVDRPLWPGAGHVVDEHARASALRRVGAPRGRRRHRQLACPARPPAQRRDSPACLKLEERECLGRRSGREAVPVLAPRRRSCGHRRRQILLDLLHADASAHRRRGEQRAVGLKRDGGDARGVVPRAAERVHRRQLCQVGGQPRCAQAGLPPSPRLLRVSELPHAHTYNNCRGRWVARAAEKTGKLHTSPTRSTIVYYLRARFIYLF